MTGHAARIFPPRRITLPPTFKAVELSRVMWISDGSDHEHFVALRPEAAVKVNNCEQGKCDWVMPARSESALRDATKAVPSAEKLTEDKVGGGNGWTCDNTEHDCPWEYNMWYSDADAPLSVVMTLTVPVLTVVAAPTDAYNGINADVEVREKLPGMRLLTATPSLALKAI